MGLYWLTGMTGQLKGKSERGWERGDGGALAQGHALGAIIVQTDVSSRRRHNRREKSGRLRESDKSEFLRNPIEVCNSWVKVHRSHFKPIWLPGSQVSIMQIRIGADQERITITIVHVSEKNALCRSFRARASFRQGRISWTRINILDKEGEYRGRWKCSVNCFSLQAI